MTMSKGSGGKPGSVLENPWFGLTAAGILAVICFYPVTRYFFLQDDFILIAQAIWPSASAAPVFGSQVEQFRPVTRLLYFKAMFGAFGLNPLPFHIISLLLHLGNCFLFYTLLRRLNTQSIIAVVVTAVFAMHVTFMNVLGWISCIQQLLGETFFLMTLLFAMRSIERGRLADTLAALACYLLALGSMEQTWGAPLVLLVWVMTRQPEGTITEKATVAAKSVAAYLIIMVAYLAFMLLYRGLPGSGPYDTAVGLNVVTNLLAYLQWVYDISVLMPMNVNTISTGVTVAHVFIVLLIVYDLARGRKDVVAIGVACYGLAILPVLILQQHTFYIHNYIPAFGALYLLVPPLTDLRLLVDRWSPGLARALPLAIILMVSIVSFTKVRANDSTYIRHDVPLAKNFVARRSTVARNMHEDLTSKANVPRDGSLFMVFQQKDSWYNQNVRAAVAQGTGVQLFFDAPRMNVFFYLRGDTLDAYDPNNSEIFFYDYTGRCLTPEEFQRKAGVSTEHVSPE
jgi:hypothetical protein